jgi:catechol 2,3-dioxygenase-like lactoylglutathione lyase family enzyme
VDKGDKVDKGKTERLIKTLKLPRVKQIGIIVNDLDEAVKYYDRIFKIGPWFRTDFTKKKHLFRGKEEVHYGIDIALAFSGKMQFELICPKDGDRNIHSDYLKSNGEGIHHLGFFVTGIEKKVDILDKLGIGVIQSGFLESKGKGGGTVTKYAYLDTAKIGGIVFELIQTKFVGVNIEMSRFWFELGNITGDVEKIKI